MALTYTAIATVTVGSGGAANIEFTSIPATYTDLLVKLSCRTDGTGDLTTYVDMVINNDTGAYYDQRNVSGMLNGTITNQSWTNQNSFYVYQVNTNSSTTNTFSNTEVYIPNYTSTNNKSISQDGVSESNTSASNNRALALVAGLYHPASNVAITSLKFTPSSNNFAQYSTATLYGIKNTV
jgi:hypothetical protein